MNNAKQSNQFVHLHTHFHTSLLDGFGLEEEYIKLAKQYGQPGIGMTDHGAVYKIYKFLKMAQKADMIGVPGCELYVAPINPEGAQVKHPVFYGKNGREGKFDVSGRGAYLHMTAWAVNNTGLKNLYKLNTLSFKPENTYKKNRIDFDMLAEHSEGLVVSTGCPSSEISTRFLLGQDDKAKEYAARLLDVFGRDRLFIEVMDHNMNIDLEKKLLPKQLKLAKDLDLQLLATNDCHYAHKEDAVHHEEFLCMQSGSVMSDKTSDEGGKRFAFNGQEYYLKTAEQMNEIFPHEDFPNATKNTLLIAEMAKDITIEFDPTLRPKAIIPEGRSEIEYFREQVQLGFEERFANASHEKRQAALEAISYEDEVIVSSDFVGYFLTVKEYLQWAKENYSIFSSTGEILASAIGPGRGSVGGSMTAYCLGISELDPIDHDLVFERFLSAGRGATYRITYEDGSTEDIVVSETKKIVEDNNISPKYIHQLNVGDMIAVEGDAS